MENKEKEETESKKTNRLKFSRLCLSQSRNAVPIRNNSKLQSSQISRFFSHSQPSDETQHNTQTQTVHQSASDHKKSVDSSENSTNDCDDHNTITSANQQRDNEIPTNSNEKKKKHSHRINMVDTKSTIKSFFSNENNDSLSDFEIPNKVPKKMPKTLPSKTSKSSRTRKQPDIRRALSKKEIASGDFSRLPEQAQIELALAMSKADTISGSVSDTSNEPFDLEKFEFKQSNAKANTDFLNIFNRKPKGKARFRWNAKCTQLTRRKDDVQKSKAREKIDEILLNNIIVESNRNCDQLSSIESIDYTSNTIYSRRLQRICVSERILFELNNCEEDTRYNNRSYYTNNLVEPSEYRAGILLKDWSRIPGRDSLYDGTAQSIDENETNNSNDINDKTDAPVISSSPVYDPPTDDDESEDQSKSDDVNSNEDSSNNNIADVDQSTETAGCADVNQKFSTTPIDTQDENGQDIAVEASHLDDGDETILIDSDDIQLKVDAINTKIRLSQNFSDIFQAPQLTYESATTTRALSPDLFDDDDDIDMTEEIQEKPKDKLPIMQEDDDTVEALPEDFIYVVSSEDTNPASIKSTQKSQDPNTQKTEANPIDIALEVIEVLDSDSEPMLKERIESPTVHIMNSNDNEKITSQIASDYNVWDDDYENLLIHGVNEPEENEIIDNMPIENVDNEQNQSTKTNGSVSLVKKMSFTERLGLFEQDMLNGFTADIPTEYLRQSQQQLSQESIELSDDEINYSMRREVVHFMNNDDFNMDYCTDLPNPIEFNCRDSDSSTNLEAEEKLVNQSICNIFEKTFENSSSPIGSLPKRKSNGAKSLKKVNSETVLSSRYDDATPSTSKVNVTPGKKSNRFVELTSPSKPKKSPLSQPIIETRKNLSNDDYLIEIGSLSPKPNYEAMDTITLEMELRKFGLKPSLRRRQAIICLEYIYNRTHPLMETCNDLNPALESDRLPEFENSQKDVENNNGAKDLHINFNIGFASHNLVDEQFKNREVSKVFLPSVPRAKKPWCLEPLHIAWHNLIKANPEARKAVLLYDPINLIELKKYFKTIEMTFDNRDLISFFDLHCITFRMIKPTKE